MSLTTSGRQLSLLTVNLNALGSTTSRITETRPLKPPDLAAALLISSRTLDTSKPPFTPKWQAAALLAAAKVAFLYHFPMPLPFFLQVHFIKLTSAISVSQLSSSSIGFPYCQLPLNYSALNALRQYSWQRNFLQERRAKHNLFKHTVWRARNESCRKHHILRRF